MILNPNAGGSIRVSEIFDEVKTLNSTLKKDRLDTYKDAILYEYFSHMDTNKIRKFVNSSEARALVEAGALTPASLDRLDAKIHAPENSPAVKIGVMQAAKDADDELWDELVKARAEERRLMNELLQKYSGEVSPIADKAQEEIIAKYVPAEYKEV